MTDTPERRDILDRIDDLLDATGARDARPPSPFAVESAGYFQNGELTIVAEACPWCGALVENNDLAREEHATECEPYLREQREQREAAWEARTERLNR